MAFLDSAPDAMVIVDPRGSIAFVNTQAEAMFGYSRDELVGEPVEVLLPERFRTRHRTHRASYFDSPRARSMAADLDLYAVRKDGREFPAEISLSPVRTVRGTFVSTAIRNNSGHKALEHALIASREQAEQANHAKSAFLAAASHDLRQPLQTLTLLSSVLSRVVPADSKAASAVASQTEALQSMGKLLNSLLDISKLEAGAVTPDIRDCSVQGIFSGLHSEFAALAESKGLELVVEERDDYIRTDPTLLGEIIQNLLGNAIRYTREGRVCLRACPGGDVVRIEVLDTGAGIPEAELESIFAEFYQTSASSDEAREGLGLGLSIAQRTAALLEHPLEVSSTVGAGSCFSVTVPKARLSALGTSHDSGSAGATNAEAVGGSVLVLDDDAAVADATAMLLDAQGFEAAVVTDVAQAEQAARDNPPRLLICDYHLEHGKNGIDVIRSIRRASACDAPAILISGDTSAEILANVDAVDDCYLLSKPVDTDELVELAARLLA